MNLRQLALEALAHYPLQIRSLRFLSKESNTHYKVITTHGERFVLRIYSDMETNLQDNQAELYWLKALERDTGLCVTTPLPDREGRYLNLIRDPDSGTEYRCVLFSWVPGRSLSHYLSPANYEKFGQVSARLHQHAGTLKLPDAICPRRWDTVFYFPDEPDLIHNPDYRGLFPPERVRLLDAVIERAEALLTRLYAEHPPILIHSDLHFWNVRLHHGRLCLLDFEAVLLGYPLQDVAVTLYYGMSRDDYPELACAFEDGYASVLPWPVQSPYQLETLWAARTVNFVNYVARIERDPRAYIDDRCADLQAYLERFG